MKPTKLILVLFMAICLFGVGQLVRAFPVGETLSVGAAEKRWGRQTYIPEKFKAGSPDERAKMAVDLIQKRSFLRKPVTDVFATLGDADGHFFSDLIPAYLLNEGWKNGTDTWQLVFMLKDDKVSEVIIQKNCCNSK